jgi:hypothetical protein
MNSALTGRGLKTLAMLVQLSGVCRGNSLDARALSG